MKEKQKIILTAPQRDSKGRWLKGSCGCPEKILRAGDRKPHQYAPGQSGNPAGISKRRAAFEQLFYFALIGEGSADEAARMLWECARNRDSRSWALPLLLQRIAPQDSKLKLEVTRGQDEIDFTRLSDAELEALERILEHARPVAAVEGGESPAESADVH